MVQLCGNRLKEFVQVHRELNALELVLRPGTLARELSPLTTVTLFHAVFELMERLPVPVACFIGHWKLP